MEVLNRNDEISSFNYLFKKISQLIFWKINFFFEWFITIRILQILVKQILRRIIDSTSSMFDSNKFRRFQTDHHINNKYQSKCVWLVSKYSPYITIFQFFMLCCWCRRFSSYSIFHAFEIPYLQFQKHA